MKYTGIIYSLVILKYMASIGKLLLVMTMVYLFQYTDRDRYLTNLNFLVPIHTKDDTMRTVSPCKLYVKMFRLRPLGVFRPWLFLYGNCANSS